MAHENPIGDQFTAAVKDLMAEKFSEGKFGTIAGIDPCKDHGEKGKRGTDSEFCYLLPSHNIEDSEGTFETEMTGEDSLTELHLGKCENTVLERRTHLMRTDTYILNESQDQLTGNGTGVSGFEDTAWKTLIRADTYIVDDDGDVHHLDTDSLGEAGRVETAAGADNGTTSERRSSYIGLDTSEPIEEEIAQVDDMDAQNSLAGSRLSLSKDVPGKSKCLGICHSGTRSLQRYGQHVNLEGKCTD